MRSKRPVALIAALLMTTQLVTAPEAQARRKKSQDSLVEAIESKIDAAMVSLPKDEETCFSPDEPCDIKLLKFIDSAQGSIDIAIYDINLDELVHHLLVKAQKIPVRIVVDRRQAKGEHSLVSTLIQGGANVRYGHQRGIMHNKFVIVDGKMVEIGSFNYTHHASQANQENQVYLAKPAVVQRYMKRFEKIWSSADPVRR
jgi:phosphatidylserine/phosphatidylglycerophosphate/cardiolipin synthase-like enzyme